MRRALSLALLCLAPLALIRAGQAAPRCQEIQLALSNALVAKLGPRVAVDAALNAAASANSLALAELGQLSASSGTSAYLRFQLAKRRVRDAVIRAAAFHGPDAASLERQLLRLLETRDRQGLTHFGIGVAASERGLVATAILVRRQVEIHALRAVLGQPLQVCARLQQGWRPRVLITTPQGQIIHRAPPDRRQDFCVRLPRARRGRYQVEVMVEGPLGPEVAALFPLHVGVPEPQLPEEKLYPEPTLKAHAVKERLRTLINRSRAERRLGALALSAELAQTAQAHSEDMRDHGFFGHRSPRRGNLEQRLARGTLTYHAAAENLALATSAFKAHEALMSSPSHRQNILDPQATHLGLGVALDSALQLLYITECFAQLEP